MGFFDGRPPPPPEPQTPRRARRVWEKPEAMLAGVASGEVLLGRSADAAIGISDFRAYPSGFELTMTVLLRVDDERGTAFRHFHDPARGGVAGDDFLRFGILFADGTSATNLAGYPHRPDGEPTAPALWPNGGGGGGRRYDMRYWVWPLPPPGPMTFVAEWPARAIPESRAEIDTRSILDAATRAIQVFPED